MTRVARRADDIHTGYIDTVIGCHNGGGEPDIAQTHKTCFHIIQLSVQHSAISIQHSAFGIRHSAISPVQAHFVTTGHIRITRGRLIFYRDAKIQ
jgi:hypothetical protein